MKRLLSLISIFILGLANVYAQSEYLFDKNQGLSNSLINNINIDNNGIIWISTNDGLNMFDGKSFMRSNVKYPNVSKTLQLSNNDVLITTNKGVLKYKYKDGSIEELGFATKMNHFTPFVTDLIYTDSLIYFSTSGYGIYTLRPNDTLIRQCPLNREIVNLYMQTMFLDSRGNIWIGTYGNNVYLVTSNSIKEIQGLPSDVCKFQEDESGNIYVASTSEGVAIINNDLSISHISIKEAGEKFPVSSLYMDGNRLLIGTDGMGLWEYHTNSQKIHNIGISDASFDFSKSKIHAIAKDSYGNIWLGIYQKGLMLITKESSIFMNYGYYPNSNLNIGSNSVGALEKCNGEIWVGTEGDGIYIINTDNSITHAEIHDSKGNILMCNIISMYNQDNKYMWIGTYNNHFIKFDIARRKTEKIFDLPCNKISSITRDADGKLLITSLGSGIGSFDTETEQFEQGILVNPSFGNCISFDHIGNYWIGTYDGIWYVDKYKRTSHKFNFYNNTLHDNTINDIYIDNDNHVWGATNNGVVILNPTDDHQTRLFENQSICSIVEDTLGFIWMSTRNGLIRYNPKNESFSNFGIENGLKSTEFSRRAMTRLGNGMACFGGTRGLTIVKNDNVTDSVRPGKIILRQLFVNNSEIEIGKTYDNIEILTKNIAEIDTIYLHERNSNFSLMFSTSNPANLAQTKFRYMMDGFNTEYISCAPGETKLSYTNLPFGTYSLNIEASIGECSTSKKVTIIIKPHWYNTWASKCAFIAALLLIAMIFIKYFQEKMARRHSEQINDMKMQFFINISHEIRTPLTLIIDPLDKLISKEGNDEETARLYKIMKINSKRILRLVSQLLDLRKMDKNQVMMRFGRTELCAFVREIVDSASPLIETKEISVNLTNNHNNKIYGWIDPENFEKIILNILHNAIKFTPIGGEIDIDIQEIDEQDTIKIIIQDNGIGISQNDLQNIFKRFYQVKSAQTRYNSGTGVGLHLARYLVEQHKGKLYAENRTDKQGSRFIIELKTGNKHLPADSIIEEQEELPTDSKDNQMKPHTDPNKKTIFVVDDEEGIRTYLSMQLMEEDYNVISFENGKKALENVMSLNPDLIISDIMMEEMDGWTLCKKVKHNYKTNHIPVILLTALTDESNKSLGIEIGADMYLEKPFNTEMLKKIIKNMIKNRENVADNLYNKADNYNIENIELKSQDEILIQKVMEIIKEKISCRDLNVETLADTIGISRVHLHRKIKEITGMTARDFLKNIRMKQASYLLTNRSLNISEIAYAVGYSNPAHFSSSFKAFYGVSPTEYSMRGNSDAADGSDNTKI